MHDIRDCYDQLHNNGKTSNGHQIQLRASQRDGNSLEKDRETLNAFGLLLLTGGTIKYIWAWCETFQCADHNNY